MNIHCNKWFMLMAALGLALSTLVGCEDQESATVLKLAHSLDTEHPVHKAMVFMADRVAQRSGGKLQIDIYPSEQLGSERECIEQVQLGMIAMTKTSTAPMEGFVPKLRVFGLPYLFRDDEHMWKVFNGPIGRELLDAGQEKYIKGLCYYDAGARSFYMKDAPVNTPADLNGKAIRVQQSKMSIDMVLAMGGNPTPVEFGELYTALQQGMVDGAENNAPSFYTSHHYDVCKYYSLDEHLRVPDVLIMSTKVWHKLSPDFQRIIQEAADESVIMQKELWAEMTAHSLEEVQKAGVTINRPDKEPFRRAVRPIWEKFEGTEVGDLAERIQEVR